MTMCNSTNQGSCRDCQNDKYLQVLMNEWTNQLQKLHPSRQYQSNLSLPYDSWAYGPEMFCSSIYCSKDFSTVSFLPYSNYTINSLSGLNVGTHQVDYSHNPPGPPPPPPQIQYRHNMPIYQPECLEQTMLNFNSKCKNSDFSLPVEPNRTIDFSKHHDSIDSIFSKQNDVSESFIIHCYSVFPFLFSLFFSSSFFARSPARDSAQSCLKDEIESAKNRRGNTCVFGGNILKCESKKEMETLEKKHFVL